MNEDKDASDDAIPPVATTTPGFPMPDPDDDGDEFEVLDKKYNKHKSEWNNISKEDYYSKAQSLKNSKVDNQNIFSYQRKNGDLIKYNKSSNEFISISSKGKIRTFFKPSKGFEYWINQAK